MSPQRSEAISDTRKPVSKAISTTIHSRTALRLFQCRCSTLAIAHERSADTWLGFRNRLGESAHAWLFPSVQTTSSTIKEFTDLQLYELFGKPIRIRFVGLTTRVEEC